MNNLNKLVTNYPVTLTPEEVKNLSMTLSAVKTASGTSGKTYNGDNTYIGVDNTNNTIRFLNDAINKLESVSSKLNTSAFSEVSGDFLTQEDLNDYATKTDLEGYQEKGNYLSANALDEISGTWENVTAKLDTTAFSTVSGNFLTEHQSLANYYQKSETSGVSELNSAFESKQNTLSAGQNITIVNNVIDLKNTDCSAFTNSIALGTKTSALGDSSVSIGYQSVAEGDISFVQGYGTNAIGNNAAAFGVQSIAKGTYSLAEGNKTSAIGAGSHAEGDRTLANYQFSHAEGEVTEANGDGSHAEGFSTKAQGNYSHSEGYATSAIGFATHAGGLQTRANYQYETVIGKFNISSYDDSILPESAKPLFAVGNGSADNSRSDAFIVTLNGIASATTLATSGISNIETKINNKQDNLTQEQLSAISSVSSIKDYVNSSFLPLSGGTVSGLTTISGSDFDHSLEVIRGGQDNNYAHIGLNNSRGMSFKAVDDNASTNVQFDMFPNNSNSTLIQVQHNGTTVGNLIPAVTATTTAGLTNDGILHIILES